MPGSPKSQTSKLQLVAKDHVKRARSFTYDILRSSEQSELLERYVSLQWSEGSSRRTSCSDLGASSECTSVDGEMFAVGGVGNALDAGEGGESGLGKWGEKAIWGSSVDGGFRKAVFGWNAWRKVLPGLILGVFLFYALSGLAPVQDAARLSGALDCLVIAAKHAGGLGRVISLHLIQNLIKSNAKNAERVVDQDLGKSWRVILKSDRQWLTEELKVASSATIAGLAAESPNPNASLFLSDTVQGLVNVFHNSESSREKITILETLAILMEISEESIASHIVNANGEEALTEILGRGTMSEVVAAAWALGNLWASQGNCSLVQETGGVSALVGLLESQENKMGAHTALFALGNLLILCPEFKVAYETQDLMSILVRLLADTLDPRLSMLGLQVTSVAASKMAKITTGIHKYRMDPGIIDEVFTSEVPTHSNLADQSYASAENHGKVQMGYREPGTVLSNLIVAIELIDEFIGRPVNQFWFVHDAELQVKNPAVHLKGAHILSHTDLAARASWVIGNLGAKNMHQQNALRQVNGIEILVKVLDSSMINPLGGQYAALALANVVAESTENKNALAQTSGVEVMMHLIGLNYNSDLAMSALTCLKAVVWEANQTEHPNKHSDLQG